MKYFVISLDEEEFLFAFPSHPKMTHKHMAEAVMSIRVDGPRGQWSRQFRLADIVSAGFINAAGECHGKSETLGLGSRKEDAALLKRQYA